MVTTDLPLVAQVDAHGRIDVCLQTPRHVMEDAFEADFARPHLAHARDVLYPLRDLVPDREEFVGGGILRGFDRMVLDDQRVQLDNLTMTVEHIDGQLAGDVPRYGRDLGIDALLHHDCLVAMILRPDFDTRRLEKLCKISSERQDSGGVRR